MNRARKGPLFIWRYLAVAQPGCMARMAWFT